MGAQTNGTGVATPRRRARGAMLTAAAAAQGRVAMLPPARQGPTATRTLVTSPPLFCNAPHEQLTVGVCEAPGPLFLPSARCQRGSISICRSDAWYRFGLCADKSGTSALCDCPRHTKAYAQHGTCVTEWAACFRTSACVGRPQGTCRTAAQKGSRRAAVTCAVRTSRGRTCSLAFQLVRCNSIHVAQDIADTVIAEACLLGQPACLLQVGVGHGVRCGALLPSLGRRPSPPFSLPVDGLQGMFG